MRGSTITALVLTAVMAVGIGLAGCVAYARWTAKTPDQIAAERTLARVQAEQPAWDAKFGKAP